MFTIVDVETTGLSPSENRIIEIAAIRVADGRVSDEHFHSLVNPNSELPTFIRYLTGIKRSELLKSPTIEEVFPDFLDYLGEGSVFVAHNAGFDFAFINEELKRYYWEPLSNKKLCTVNLARRTVPGLHSYSLKNLINHFGFDHEKNHRALDDVRITAQLFLELLKINPNVERFCA